MILKPGTRHPPTMETPLSVKIKAAKTESRATYLSTRDLSLALWMFLYVFFPAGACVSGANEFRVLLEPWRDSFGDMNVAFDELDTLSHEEQEALGESRNQCQAHHGHLALFLEGC